MEISQADIVERMRKAIQQSRGAAGAPTSDIAVKDTKTTNIMDSEWVKSLPSAGKDEFIMYLEYKNERFVVCAKELDWIIMQNIDVECYKISTLSGDPYYTEEHRRREILSKAIVWIADVNAEQIMNNDGTILSKVKHEYIDVIWIKYESLVSLTIKEAAALESSALAYFKRDVDKKPIPSDIIEVDMLLHFGNLSWDEIRNISYSKMEKIKLILKARADALELDSQKRDNEKIRTKKADKIDNALNGMPPGLFPPGMRQQIVGK